MADNALERMQQQIARWSTTGDRRLTFLRCYAAMTENMLQALQGQEFADPPWVRRLLEHFAGYYFQALADWESAPAAAPAVWQQAHRAALDPDTNPLQNLILGVNAHINYDLVLAEADLLRLEWEHLSPATRRQRHHDHCQVNVIIARTVDQVQDDILEPDAPWLAWVDDLLGPLDEWAVSRLITRWRAQVWRHALSLTDLQEPERREAQRRVVEAETLRLGELLLGRLRA